MAILTANITQESAENIIETLHEMRIGMKPMESQTIPMLNDTEDLSISEYKLRELWSKGILSDLAYISFALQFNPARASLDAAQFAREWSLDELSEFQVEEGWKVKRLKKRAILNAIAILEEKGFLIADTTVSLSQLSLFD